MNNIDNNQSIEKLNELLKGEKMAANIYEETKGLQGDSQVKDFLEDFAQDHHRHAQQLEKRINQLGGNPNENIGMSGVMANMMAKLNAIRGPKHLLNQIYKGESMGVKAYEERINDLDPLSQEIVQELIKEDKEHLRKFEARVDEERRES
ncbi:PA2169 family four-helix-bundle protein [Natroniella sulfidigena]|uniref:demethoxyubiquinone hydroxylase family protein n=1 Tax=Natroniella sulfidigena TaxID=723921 RepID=UPI0031F4A4EC|nr:PA2169 family four-helix-bundle protein [Natroniella sulfidigena]